MAYLRIPDSRMPGCLRSWVGADVFVCARARVPAWLEVGQGGVGAGVVDRSIPKPKQREPSTGACGHYSRQHGVPAFLSDAASSSTGASFSCVACVCSVRGVKVSGITDFQAGCEKTARHK